nr:urea carboxylase [Desulfuromonadales bacterium]
PVGRDGTLAERTFVDGHSVAGDYVDLRAEMDALAVISNCPQENNPCNGAGPTPIRVVIYRP